MPDDMWATLERQSAAKAYEDKLAALAATIAAGLVARADYDEGAWRLVPVNAVNLAAEIIRQAKAIAARAVEQSGASEVWLNSGASEIWLNSGLDVTRVRVDEDKGRG